MVARTIKILALSGSLRPGSSNNNLVKLVGGMMPAGTSYEIYTGLAGIPAFDDNDNEPVNDFRQQIREADGIFICTPEYAFGVPGALKNALDWTVSTGDLYEKPVALVTASSVGDKAHASLLQTLTALTAYVAPGASLLIPFIRAKLNANGVITDPSVQKDLQELVHAFIEAIRSRLELQ